MLPHHLLSIKEVRTGTQTGRILEVGADAEAMEGAAYWLALIDHSACCVIEPSRTSGPNDSRLGPPTLILMN